MIVLQCKYLEYLCCDRLLVFMHPLFHLVKRGCVSGKSNVQCCSVLLICITGRKRTGVSLRVANFIRKYSCAEGIIINGK